MVRVYGPWFLTNETILFQTNEKAINHISQLSLRYLYFQKRWNRDMELLGRILCKFCMVYCSILKPFCLSFLICLSFGLALQSPR
jgi:hypothetical protein